MTGFWRLNFCWSWSMNSSQSLALKNIQSATWKCLLNRPKKWHRSDYIWPVPANHGPPAEDTNRFESARDFEICWSKIWKIFGPGPWISDRYLIFTCLEILSISFVQFPCPSDKQQLSCILYRNYCTAYRYQIRDPFLQVRCFSVSYFSNFSCYFLNLLFRDWKMNLQCGWLTCSLAPPLRPQTTESYFWIIFNFLSKARTSARSLLPESGFSESNTHIQSQSESLLEAHIENLPKPEFVNASFTQTFPVIFEPMNPDNRFVRDLVGLRETKTRPGNRFFLSAQSDGPIRTSKILLVCRALVRSQ